MKPRNLIILAVIVLVVGAYILFYERHQPTSDERAERSDKLFPTLERDEVGSIEIHNSHGEFHLVRSGDDWRLITPIDFAADTATVNSLLGSLLGLRQERRLEADEVDPGAYGLDEPQMHVILSTADDERLSLEVGQETPLGSNRAVRISGDDAVIICAGWFASDLDKELDSWRSRDVVDEWRLLEPVSDLADGDHLQNLISNLSSLRVEEFLDDELNPSVLGLDSPEYRVTLIRSEGGDTVELEFGTTREQDSATQVACRRNGRDVFWANDVAATRLAKAPVLWRASKLYDFNTWDAEMLTISSDGQRLRLDRSEGLWQEESGGELDYTAVQDRLSKLAELEVREFDLMQPLTEEMGRLELGLEATDDEAEARTISYTFNRPLAEGGDALVTVSTRDTVMSVDAAEVYAILSDPDSLRKPEEPEVEEQEVPAILSNPESLRKREEPEVEEEEVEAILSDPDSLRKLEDPEPGQDEVEATLSDSDSALKLVELE
jgi:hypothetical protein